MSCGRTHGADHSSSIQHKRRAFAVARNGAKILIDNLIVFGVDTLYGMPGDSINGLMEAIRTRAGHICFIQVRHEESAAFAAVAGAKLVTSSAAA